MRKTRSMMRFAFRRRNGAHLVFVVTALLALAAFAQPAIALESFERSELTILTETGEHRFTVELASTSAQRAQGLMFRSELPADHGMLFDYRRDQPVSMWMKNTLIPLDMLFLAADGTVRGTHQRAVPHSLESIKSPGRVRAVLELNGGTVSRLKIKPGDKVRHPLFQR